MKLSIIIPMYQAEEYLFGLIDTLAKQNQKEKIEYIFVDDGSKDDTYELCEKLCEQNLPSAKVVRNTRTKGVSGARNTGIQLAKGDYVTFLDVDDRIALEYIARVLVIIENAKDSENKEDVVIIGYRHIGSDGNLLGTVAVEKEGLFRRNEFMKVFFSDLYANWLINPCWNKLYYRGFLLQNDILFPEGFSMGEDLNFSLRVVAVAEWIRTINCPLYLHVEHDGDRLTSGFRRDKLEMQIRNFEILQELHKRYAYSGFQEQVLRFYDDVQSYLDDAYYVSGMKGKEAYGILKGIASSGTIVSVLKEIESEDIQDWKYPYLRKREVGILHRKMMCRKWKGKISKWIHRNK